MAQFTVVFADLTGSSKVFEALGNIEATRAITRLTQWIGSVCEAHRGHVVKFLGDGVLILFQESVEALDAASELHKIHFERIIHSPGLLEMRLQVGMARGEVIEQAGDYYGDAVNLASRLSDLSGSEQILVCNSVIQHVPEAYQLRARCLGPMLLRGRNELCVVHRVEWQEAVLSDFFTIPGSLTASAQTTGSVKPASVELSRLDSALRFISADCPVFLGRDADAQFALQDPRASRKHAMIEWRSDRFYLTDMSSYGTWIRFNDSQSIVFLRRQECMLVTNGEIALSASFDDFTNPTINFRLNE